MNTSIAKEVTVYLELDLDELAALNLMLFEWRRDIGDKLPSPISDKQRYIIDSLNSVYDRGMQ